MRSKKYSYRNRGKEYSHFDEKAEAELWMVICIKEISKSVTKEQAHLWLSVK